MYGSYTHYYNYRFNYRVDLNVDMIRIINKRHEYRMINKYQTWITI